ncbi:hypothetical protein CB1_000770019 [Camelus ferus]|nr:hypothetical protein CB1_000770019 [Camelus ferus]
MAWEDTPLAAAPPLIGPGVSSHSGFEASGGKGVEPGHAPRSSATADWFTESPRSILEGSPGAPTKARLRIGCSEAEERFLQGAAAVTEVARLGRPGLLRACGCAKRPRLIPGGRPVLGMTLCDLSQDTPSQALVLLMNAARSLAPRMGPPASVVSEPPPWQAPTETRGRKQASANIFQDAELLQIQGLFQRSGDQLAEERAQIVWECAGDHHVAEALKRLRRKRPPRPRPLSHSLHHCSRLRAGLDEGNVQICLVGEGTSSLDTQVGHFTTMFV